MAISDYTVRAHIGRSAGRFTPPPPQVDLSVDLNGNFSFTVRAHIGRSTGRSTPLGISASGSEWLNAYTESLGRPGGRSTPSTGI